MFYYGLKNHSLCFLAMFVAVSVVLGRSKSSHGAEWDLKLFIIKKENFNEHIAVLPAVSKLKSSDPHKNPTWSFNTIYQSPKARKEKK